MVVGYLLRPITHLAETPFFSPAAWGMHGRSGATSLVSFFLSGRAGSARHLSSEAALRRDCRTHHGPVEFETTCGQKTAHARESACPWEDHGGGEGTPSPPPARAPETRIDLEKAERWDDTNTTPTNRVLLNDAHASRSPGRFAPCDTHVPPLAQCPSLRTVSTSSTVRTLRALPSGPNECGASGGAMQRRSFCPSSMITAKHGLLREKP